MGKLAVIGAGQMGEALVRGLVDAGWPPSDVVFADILTEHARAVAARLGAHVAADNAEAVSGAEAVLVAVKPQDALGALAEVGKALTADAAVISIVAGLRIASIQEAVGADAPVVRAMPNTPARVGKGATALAAGTLAGEAARACAERIFGAVGPVVWLDEKHLDAVTALSGSGPAYVFLVAEAMVDAGVTLGLPRDVAATLAYATIEGAGTMLATTGLHPAELRAQVTSPGGTTAAGVAVLEGMAVRAAFIEAIRAAQRRSREMG